LRVGLLCWLFAGCWFWRFGKKFIAGVGLYMALELISFNVVLVFQGFEGLAFENGYFSFGSCSVNCYFCYGVGF
jgi:hypothetical protein